MGVTPYFSKSPFDVVIIGLDFTDQIPAGVTIASGICSARNMKTEVDASATILGTGAALTPTIDTPNNIGKIAVKAGTLGTWYEVFMDVTLSDSQKRRGRALVFVDQ